jgi:hypothetical protein
VASANTRLRPGCAFIPEFLGYSIHSVG